MELLSIEPQELKFQFELKKQISTTLQLSNKIDRYVAFKKTNSVVEEIFSLMSRDESRLSGRKHTFSKPTFIFNASEKQ